MESGGRFYYTDLLPLLTGALLEQQLWSNIVISTQFWRVSSPAGIFDGAKPDASASNEHHTLVSSIDFFRQIRVPAEKHPRPNKHQESSL